MSALGRVTGWLRAVVFRNRAERDMKDEMHAHIEQAIERYTARGMSVAHATREAHLEFGNVAVLQEHARDARGGRWVDNVRGDVRFALRYYARTPLTTAAILFVLTLGIGINSAILSVGSALLLRPAPGVPDEPSLVIVRGRQIIDAHSYPREFSWHEFAGYEQLNHLFSAVAGWASADLAVDLGDVEVGLQTVRAQFVTPNFFSTLGVHVAVGREFSQARFDTNSEAEHSAILSEVFANDNFGGAANAIGRTFNANGIVIEVVGVMPPRFNGALRSGVRRTMWLPLSAMRTVQQSTNAVFQSRDSARFTAIARLRDNETVKSVSSEVKNVALRLQLSSASTSSVKRSAITDVVRIRGSAARERGFGDDGPIVATAFGILVILILLLCTTTVASLLAGAGVARRHEIAIRRSLGASRIRIVRQLVTESTLLSLVAALAGLGIYAVVMRVISNRLLDTDADPSWQTVLATAVFALFVSLLCSLSPALHATRNALADVLKDAAPGSTVRSGLQRALVIAQIALTQPLLVGVAAVIYEITSEIDARGGSVLSNRLVVVSFDYWAMYNGRVAKRAPDILQRVSQLPGVVSAIPTFDAVYLHKVKHDAGSSRIDSSNGGTVFDIASTVTWPGYFAHYEIPLLAGRDFNETDNDASATPIVVSTDAATALFGRRNPIGERLRYVGEGNSKPLEIIGVVSPKYSGPWPAGKRMHLFTSNANERFVQGISIRTTGPAEPLLPALRSVVMQAAPMIPIREIKTRGQVEQEERHDMMLSAGAAAAAGALTLFLASIGLYAVVALGVAQRRREIGIRIALGALPRQVATMFFSSGVRLSFVGLFIGLPFSATALWVISDQLGEIKANPLLISVVIAIAVTSVAATATWLPARKASTVDPNIALRAK